MDHDFNPDPDQLVSFEPARTQRQRRNGWTVDRQKLFVQTLAETGCATYAASVVGLSSSSAYRLAAKPAAAMFARAWDEALIVAGRRLLTIGFEHVIDGVRETFWKDGVCVGERRKSSERLHVFLLKQLYPNGIAQPRELLAGETPTDVAAAELRGLMNEFDDDDDPAAEAEPDPVALPPASRVDP